MHFKKLDLKSKNAKFVGNETYKDGSRAYEAVSQDKPDVILCISDEQAIGHAHSASVNVPNDLQVVEFQ